MESVSDFQGTEENISFTKAFTWMQNLSSLTIRKLFCKVGFKCDPGMDQFDEEDISLFPSLEDTLVNLKEVQVETEDS